MQKRVIAAMAGALVLGATGAVPATAHGGHSEHGGQGGHGGHGGSTGHGAHQGHGTQGTQGGSAFGAPAKGPVTTFAISLSGAQEVPTPGGPAVNDPDGKASGYLTLRGDRLTYSLQWKGLVPSLGHIHEGAKGKNGALKVTLFGAAMPDSVDRAAGHVSLTDAKLAAALRKDPAGFYVNLHSAEFPGGAVRGQLKKQTHPVNPLDVLRPGSLTALSNGEQEVPKTDTSKVNDPDGQALTTLAPKGTGVGYSLAWVNIQSPSLGHIHRGVFGKNGDVVFNLFNRPVPTGVFAVSGKLNGQSAAAVKRVRAYPAEYYSNIHNLEYPDGAVRGQLFG
ncbi:CHRD domain-containing protein [Streptomyces sp. NPDC000594]|uniref:CHRD domain-containing protein n=1 Tax=Streptomyces sp. NPDC000594 TaxID=3154261 RepID=UPI003333A0E3